MVRPGPLVLVLVVAVTLTHFARATSAAPRDGDGPAAKAGEEKKAPIGPTLDQKPYKIRAWVAIAPGTRIDAKGRAALVKSWLGLAHRLVGAPWSLEVADGPGPTPSVALESLTAEVVSAEASDCDKAWIVRIDQLGGGFVIHGRALDVTTARLGPVARREAPYPDDLARDLMMISLELFTPTAEITGSTYDNVDLVVQGASLLPSDPIGRVVSPETIFRPIRVGLTEEGEVTRIQDIPYSYLRVASVEGARAKCKIHTGIRDPLTKAVLGRYRMVALGVKASATPTRFRFVTDSIDRRPAAGYNVVARTVPFGPPRDLGFTDREGRLTIEPGFADSLIVMRVLAAGVEPLREFPVMPGESIEERAVPVDPLARTVAIDTQLNALRDEIVDVVAVRNRIERKAKARAEAGFWDEIPPMVEEFRKLTGHDLFAQRLEKIKEDAKAEQTKVKKVILTRHSQMLINDTSALIEKYLDDGMILGIEQAYKEAKGLAKPSTPSPAPKPPG